MYRIYTVYILKMQQYRISEVRNIDIVVTKYALKNEGNIDLTCLSTHHVGVTNLGVKMTEVIEVTNLG